jgi:hypothetical protein
MKSLYPIAPNIARKGIPHSNRFLLNTCHALHQSTAPIAIHHTPLRGFPLRVIPILCCTRLSAGNG